MTKAGWREYLSRAVSRVARIAIAVVVVTLSAGVTERSLAQHGASRMPIRIGCPSKSERLGMAPATVDRVIAVARTVVARQVTHYQGRTERRNARNTPVNAVVMDLGIPFRRRQAGRTELLREARAICGNTVAQVSNAVVFVDALSPIAGTLIPVFVVRTDRSWRVFPKLQP
jgi:hypothetical protein